MQTRPPIAGRYRLLQLLGQGGMGEVWQARDEVLERDVAVKLLKAVGDPVMADRFRREALSTAAVTHDDVVQIYDAGVVEQPNGTLVYLVMEMLPGPTLAEAIERHGRMPIDLAVELTSQVASALAAAHRAGVVHRDVKPANLMFDDDGRLTVLDFGIAAVAADEQAGPALTSTGQIIGSPTYLSPEQASGQPVGPAADVYSLGCVLFQMLTATPPYEGQHPLAVLHRHLADPVPHVNDRVPVPPALDQLVASMMAKDPAVRPTAQEVAATLRRGVPTEVVEATEVMRTQPANRPLEGPLALPTNPTAKMAGDQPSPAWDRHRPVRRPRERPFPVGRLVGALVVVVLCALALSALVNIDPSDSDSSSQSQSDDGKGWALPKWNDDQSDPKNSLDRLDQWRRRAERFHVISEEKSQEWKQKIDEARDLVQRGQDANDKIQNLRDQMSRFSR